MHSHSLFEADLAEEIHGTTSTSSESTNHKRFDALSAASECLPDMAHHRCLVHVRLKTTQLLPLLVCSHRERASSRARKASMKPERSNAPAARIGQEFEIVECPPTTVESIEDGGPPGLLLVAMCELDVRMGQGISRFGEFFEADDRDVGRRGGP